jgi:hypothetical protein
MAPANNQQFTSKNIPIQNSTETQKCGVATPLSHHHHHHVVLRQWVQNFFYLISSE